mgnify:CR=1 FL=1
MRGVTRDDVASVGDSNSDGAMFAQSRIRIAFRPFHQDVADAATHVVEYPDLSRLSGVLLRND